MTRTDLLLLCAGESKKKLSPANYSRPGDISNWGAGQGLGCRYRQRHKRQKCCHDTCDPPGYPSPKATLLPSQLRHAVYLDNPILSHPSSPRIGVQTLLLPSAHTDYGRGKLTAASAPLTCHLQHHAHWIPPVVFTILQNNGAGKFPAEKQKPRERTEIVHLIPA